MIFIDPNKKGNIPLLKSYQMFILIIIILENKKYIFKKTKRNKEE